MFELIHYERSFRRRQSARTQVDSPDVYSSFFEPEKRNKREKSAKRRRVNRLAGELALSASRQLQWLLFSPLNRQITDHLQTKNYNQGSILQGK